MPLPEVDCSPHQQIIIMIFRVISQKALETASSFRLPSELPEGDLSQRKIKDKGLFARQKSCWLTLHPKHLGEFLGIFPDVHTTFDVNEAVIDRAVSGLERLRYFSSVNIYSFNIGLFLLLKEQRIIVAPMCHTQIILKPGSKDFLT